MHPDSQMCDRLRGIPLLYSILLKNSNLLKIVRKENG
jgi:hypothetical protein